MSLSTVAPSVPIEKLQILADAGYRTLAVDSQILASISLCEMRTNLRFMHKYELVEEEKADYLDRGDLLHTALKIYYTLKKRTDRFTFDDRVQIAVDICRKKSVTLDVDAIESESYLDVFKQYCQFHKAESWIPVEVEQPFSVLLHVDHDLRLIFVYEGVIDLIIEGFGQGNYEIVDHKGTARRYTPTELTFQFLGYCWAFGYNTLIAQQVGFQKTLAADKKFLRHRFSFPQENLDEWKENAIKFLTRWVKTMDSGNYLMSYNGLACTAFNRVCPYYKYYCKATPDSREWNLQTKFNVGKEWSPWTRDDELDKALEVLMK